MTQKEVTVAAVMTAPRYESVWARNKIEHALHGIGIPLTISGGVFYGQCMQHMLISLVESDVDFALTVDFDSIFTTSHVQRLLDIISHNEEIDAIAAVQPMRNSGRILGTRGVGEQIAYDGNPIRVRTAHFGLTVLRLAKLATVPVPWFQSIPNKDGLYEEGKVDDDVHFWFQWEKAGNSLYLDPGTRLGHLEEMITVFDEEMNPTHVYPKQWDEFSASTVD